MKKNVEDINLFSTDSSLKKDECLDQIKTTNINVLLNRVKIEKKNDLKKKIFISSLMFAVITIFTIFTNLK